MIVVKINLKEDCEFDCVFISGFFSGFVTVQRLKNWLMMGVNACWHIAFSNFTCVIIFVEVHMLTAVSVVLTIFFFIGKTYLRDFIPSSFS